MILWNLENKIQEIVFEGHLDWVRSVIFYDEDKFIISCSQDCTVRIWNVGEKKQEKILRKSNDHWITKYKEFNFF